MNTVIREDHKCKAEEDLEKKRLSALNQGNLQEVTPEIFNQLRAYINSKKLCSAVLSSNQKK